MASKARTIGKVGGTASPGSPGWPTAAAKALTRSVVTVRGAGAGNSRPTREGSTGMSRP